MVDQEQIDAREISSMMQVASRHIRTTHGKARSACLWGLAFLVATVSFAQAVALPPLTPGDREKVAALTFISAQDPATTDAILVAARFAALLQRDPELDAASIAESTSRLRAQLSAQPIPWADFGFAYPGHVREDPVGLMLSDSLAELGGDALGNFDYLIAMLDLFSEPGAEPLRPPLAVHLRLAAVDAAGWVWASLYTQIARRPDLKALADEIINSVAPQEEEAQTWTASLGLDVSRDLDVAAVQNVRDRLDEPLGLLALTLKDLHQNNYGQPEVTAEEHSDAEAGLDRDSQSTQAADQNIETDDGTDDGGAPQVDLVDATQGAEPQLAAEPSGEPVARVSDEFAHQWARAWMRRFLLHPQSFPGRDDPAAIALQCARLAAQFSRRDELELFLCLDGLDNALALGRGNADASAAQIMLTEAVSTYASARAAEIEHIDTRASRHLRRWVDAFAAPSARSGEALRRADASARIWLLDDSLEGYADQPFRESLQNELAVCMRLGLRPPVGPPAPISAGQYTGCLGSFENWALGVAVRSDAAGDSDGPFATTQLDRELELPAWQRINYLRGYLNQLVPECSEPSIEVVNPIEWSAGSRSWLEFALSWPLYGPDVGRGPVRNMGVAGLDLIAALAQPCDQDDGVTRVLRSAMENYRSSLAAFALALDARRQLFRDRELASGADVDLTGAADQVSKYRPEDQAVGPCQAVASCGVSAQFPASRALFGLFPSPYLLADQSRLGSVSLCYANVRWVDRSQAPSATNDPKLSTYFGKLSFELRGHFTHGGQDEVVFARRLTSHEEYEYLLGENSTAVLENPCPMDLVGTSVVSELPPGRGDLVPRKLTYLTAARSDPIRLFAANWDQGEEWRDQFISDERVEVLVEPQYQALMEEVAQHLAQLKAKLDRELYLAMMRAPGPASEEDAALSNAALELSVGKTLLSRLARIYLPQSIVIDESLRASLYGSEQLMDRSGIAIYRGLGRDPVELPAEMRRRMVIALDVWLPFLSQFEGQELERLVLNTLVALKAYNLPPVNKGPTETPVAPPAVSPDAEASAAVAGDASR